MQPSWSVSRAAPGSARSTPAQPSEGALPPPLGLFDSGFSVCLAPPTHDWLPTHQDQGSFSCPQTSDAKSSASLYTGARLNLGDRVLGEVEKSSFIALPGKRAHSRLTP